MKTMAWFTGLFLAGTVLIAAKERTEPIGPSSRRTPLVVSEILFNPAPRSDGRDLEFIEIYNSEPWDQDLSNFRLAGDVHWTFPLGTVLSSNAFLVVAKAPADVRLVSGKDNVVGGYEGRLSKTAGHFQLEHRNGGVLAVIDYHTERPWPAAAAEAGHSLVLARPSLGEGTPAAWEASAFSGGSPGGPEPVDPDPRRLVLINEFFAGGTTLQPDFIELYNPSTAQVDLSGCILTDQPSLFRYRIADGTRIGPGGLLAFSRAQLGFGLSRSGGALYLWNSAGTAVLDGVWYEAQMAGYSSGRFPDGAPGFRTLGNLTAGRGNAPPFVHPIVINELMYAPISEDSDDEYVEIYNRGAERVDVSGWQFTSGIHFRFPLNTSLSADAFLVVARKASRLMTNHPNLNRTNLVGDYEGSLANRGERLTLVQADGVVVDEVTYGSNGAWGKWANKGGSSLELLDPRGDHNDPANWGDSDETQKAPWSTVEFTGKLAAPGMNPVMTPNSIYLLLLGPGECLVDDVEATPAGGANLVSNPTFQAGLAGWMRQGNHERTRLEPSGFQDDASLRLCATERGDSIVNRVGTHLKSNIGLGNTATVRAQVRWLCGCPEILLRVIGNQLEAYGRLDVPRNLGTPGARNSRALANAGPAILAVEHAPVLASPNEPVTVTARVTDPDGVGAVLLSYRLDPGLAQITLPMTDSGRDGDQVAGDGVMTAVIPGQASGQLIAFSISAQDAAPAPATSVFPADTPARECLVRIGERTLPGPFGAYRLWMTEANLQRWGTRQPASDEPLPCTFVYNGARVVHGVGASYGGSAGSAKVYYKGPTATSCDYVLIFPETDRFLGVTDVRLCWPGIAGRLPDPILQVERTCFWLAEQAGLATAHRRFVYFFFNGIRRGELLEDSQKPNADYVAEWFPQNAEGDLYKLLIPMESDDPGRAPVSFGPARALFKTSLPTNTPPERAYRWTWNKRAVRGSQNDLQNIYELLDGFNLSDATAFTERVDQLVDVGQWMRTLAVERLVGNFDSFGFANDQNMYFYKPRGGQWQLLMWDVDLALALRLENPAEGASLAVWSNSARDKILSHSAENSFFRSCAVSAPEIRFLQHPPFCREYLRALAALVEGPMPGMNAEMDKVQAVFTANQIISRTTQASVTDAQQFVTQRIASVQQQLAPYRVPFAILAPASGSITNTEPSATLTGLAPFTVASLKVNGAIWPVTWSTVTNWSLVVPLHSPTQSVTVAGYDAAGEPVAGASGAVQLVCLGAPLSPAAPIVINEWMAANTHTLIDSATGTYEDWFELFNPNPAAVDITGYRLTDDSSDASKFVVPDGWSIPARGCLLVWADDHPSANATDRALHVNFRLARAGDSLALFSSAGQLIDQAAFGIQSNDVSQGRAADGSVVPFAVPSPGAPNFPALQPGFQILSMSLSRTGDVTLEWSTVVGRGYRVESATDLAHPDWRSISETTATAATTSLTVRTNTAPQQFYRVVQP